MAKTIDFDTSLSRTDINHVRRRFLAIHQQRLRRLENELGPKQQDFLRLLPLLLHINDPVLPGYINMQVPAGLPDYSPDRATLLIAKQFNRNFDYHKRALLSIPIEGLYLMGSIGTVGQSRDSDLDFWLCHAHDMTDEDRMLLQSKAELIEKHAMEYGMEVHFFLMDAVAFRKGQKLTISSESSGSTQHYLLLEEFYRTGVLVAGRSPLWWMVPSKHEVEYQDYVDFLIRKNHVDSYDYLDFGGMTNVPAEEFFGAAHWQLYKGIESPYKSILKILLMESYAADFPDIPWLSLQTKQAVYDGDEGLMDLDPYILIYRQVESYLIARGQDERLDLARRCFYFKTKMTMSRQRRNDTHWKYIQLKQLIDEWGWSDRQIIDLDGRDHWKLEQVQKERNILVRELTNSFRILMNFARNHAATGGIDPKELNLLGRKLYAALERRPGKIDFINPGISRDLTEAELCIVYEIKRDQIRWLLFRQESDYLAAVAPLKTTSNLLELLTWCHCNQILGRHSRILMSPLDCPVTLNEVKQIMDLLQQALPKNHKKAELSQLGKKPYSLLTRAFINIGFDPLSSFSKAGLQLTSTQTDALSYSSKHLNLAQNIEILSINSWGEIEVNSYQGSDGLLESLCRYLHSQTLQRKPRNLTFNGFGSSKSQNIAKRLTELNQALLKCFFTKKTALQNRFILQIEHRFACIYCLNKQFSFQLFDSQTDLYEFLGDKKDRFQAVIFDDRCQGQSPLSAIYQANKEDCLQLFSWKRDNGTQLFVIDELGTLFVQFVANADPQHLLIQQQRFLNSLADRQSLLSEDAAARLLFNHPEFYQITKKPDGHFKVSATQLPFTSVVDQYVDLELVVGNDPDTLSNYAVICGDREFDYLNLNQELYKEVAVHILNMRRDAATYPVYLTSIAPPTSMENDNAWSTIRLLNFKKRLETQINIALGRLANNRLSG